MAASVSVSSLTFNSKPTKPHFKTSPTHINPFIFQNDYKSSSSKLTLLLNSIKPRRSGHLAVVTEACSSDGFLDKAIEDDTKILSFSKGSPAKYLLWVLVWASLSLAWFAASGDANAAADSIKASSFGLEVASGLRSSGWPDEAVVFALATLPIIELRGAIPVGYWMQLKPLSLTVLSVLGFVFLITLIQNFISFSFLVRLHYIALVYFLVN